jgi:hypothetical protein
MRDSMSFTHQRLTDARAQHRRNNADLGNLGNIVCRNHRGTSTHSCSAECTVKRTINRSLNRSLNRDEHDCAFGELLLQLGDGKSVAAGAMIDPRRPSLENHIHNGGKFIRVRRTNFHAQETSFEQYE